MRMVIPSIEWLSDVRVNQWIVRLPEDHPLRQQHNLLLGATAPITWTSAFNRHLAVSNGLRILLARGYDSLRQIQDDDLKLLSSRWSRARVRSMPRSVHSEYFPGHRNVALPATAAAGG